MARRHPLTAWHDGYNDVTVYKAVMPFTRRERHYLHPAGETQFACDVEELTSALLVEWKRNLVAHGDAREEK